MSRSGGQKHEALSPSRHRRREIDRGDDVGGQVVPRSAPASTSSKAGIASFPRIAAGLRLGESARERFSPVRNRRTRSVRRSDRHRCCETWMMIRSSGGAVHNHGEQTSRKSMLRNRFVCLVVMMTCKASKVGIRPVSASRMRRHEFDQRGGRWFCHRTRDLVTRFLLCTRRESFLRRVGRAMLRCGGGRRGWVCPIMPSRPNSGLQTHILGSWVLLPLRFSPQTNDDLVCWSSGDDVNRDARRSHKIGGEARF